MICVPILIVGFNEVIGSWKIIAISLPRMSSRLLSGSVARSKPSKRTEPPTIFAGGCGRSPMIERAVTDLPQPDSPTTPSVLPFSTSKLTPSTARTTPSRVKKCVWRSSTSRMANLGLLRPRVERVAQAVRDEVRAEDERRDREARNQDHVRVRSVHLAPLLGHGPPGGVGRVDAEPDEREERLAQDHAGQLEEDRDDQHPKRVRNEVASEDAVPAGPHRCRGPDVVVLFERDDLPADDPRRREPARDRERDDHRPGVDG